MVRLPLQSNRLFEVGVIVLVIGAVVALIGGIGEVGYIQCVAASRSECTAASSTEYITVFLASADTLSVGLSVAAIGAVILIGGSIGNYLVKLANELKSSIAPMGVCPKCGIQVGNTIKFCPNCGNKLRE
jgi:hypothetical protein